MADLHAGDRHAVVRSPGHANAGGQKTQSDCLPQEAEAQWSHGNVLHASILYPLLYFVYWYVYAFDRTLAFGQLI
jgi:hypothetical protein